MCNTGLDSSQSRTSDTTQRVSVKIKVHVGYLRVPRMEHPLNLQAVEHLYLFIEMLFIGLPSIDTAGVSPSIRC